ncbi:hypothetical protein [Rossellomorea marisflavi]|uniref:hypothetical protein n=1 Tax=Rossellomorea marisflavi TaxID=189381 RepID=UPI003519D102
MFSGKTRKISKTAMAGILGMGLTFTVLPPAGAEASSSYSSQKPTASEDRYNIDHYWTNDEVNEVLDAYSGQGTVGNFVGFVATLTGNAPLGLSSFYIGSAGPDDAFKKASRNGTGVRISYDYVITPGTHATNKMENKKVQYY